MISWSSSLKNLSMFVSPRLPQKNTRNMHVVGSWHIGTDYWFGLISLRAMQCVLIWRRRILYNNETGDETHYLLTCNNSEISSIRETFMRNIRKEVPQLAQFSDKNIIDYCMILHDQKIQMPTSIFIKNLLCMYNIKKNQKICPSLKNQRLSPEQDEQSKNQTNSISNQSKHFPESSLSS